MPPDLNPDEVLKKALDLATAFSTGPNQTLLVTDAVRLGDLVLALDRWITAGGRLPSRWGKPPTTGGASE